MTFKELWAKVKELKALPDTAVLQIPTILSDETKRKLSRKPPKEAAVIITEAIDEVNRGSVKALDELIGKRL